MFRPIALPAFLACFDSHINSTAYNGTDTDIFLLHFNYHKAHTTQPTRLLQRTGVWRAPASFQLAAHVPVGLAALSRLSGRA